MLKQEKREQVTLQQRVWNDNGFKIGPLIDRGKKLFSQKSSSFMFYE